LILRDLRVLRGKSLLKYRHFIAILRISNISDLAVDFTENKRMDHETIQAIALMLGASWASGINLYAAILVLGILGNTGYAELPEGLALVENPLVLGVAGIMYFIEFFADKTPGVDSGWDAIHTFIRIPAGAMMAVGAASGIEVNQPVTLAAALLGAGVAANSH
jgi:hypothetical protein